MKNLQDLQSWHIDYLRNKVRDDLKFKREELEEEEDMERCGHLEEEIADFEEILECLEGGF